jgi:hypothetical protein
MTLRQAPPRNVVVVVSVVLAFTVLGLAVLAWIFAPPHNYGFLLAEKLEITNVQFSDGFLTVMVNNTGKAEDQEIDLAVTEVMVQPMQSLPDAIPTSAPFEVKMNILVHLGDQASIAVGYDWIPGMTYVIRVTSSRGNYWSIKAVASIHPISVYKLFAA